ncbi:MAG: hypothetical protein NWE77_04025 [Candidatus Bathyarchaeota archaeon]|nr:hypothetical protein [Candidatus Bathyarchaeota archaeon]UCD40341.1 MAG: hypothetical protein JSV87_02055 [Candidatus Bathyarchaeota archaeon]
MRWKIFKTKRSMGPAKEKMLRLVSVERKDHSVSLSPLVAAPREAANLLRNYSMEAELKKAQGLMHRRMFEQPR